MMFQLRTVRKTVENVCFLDVMTAEAQSRLVDSSIYKLTSALRFREDPGPQVQNQHTELRCGGSSGSELMRGTGLSH